MMDGMTYEDAISYVFDRCGRGGGPKHIAEADLWRGAASRGEWAKVDAAMVAALKRIQEDAGDIKWVGRETTNGGAMHNFNNPLAEGIEALESNANDPIRLRWALLVAIHALKASVLKASGEMPPKYLGDKG